MTSLSPSLRKAAVLISALDGRTAEALLEQMGAEHSALVRSALVELDDIPADEQQQVLAEFLRQQGRPTLRPASDGDVTLELASERELPPTAASQPAAAGSASEPPLAFLQQVAAQPLAELLRREHPQTVAVVIAHLPPEHAADVLELLPSALATEALERMASLHELAPEVCLDLARELRQQLAPHLASSGGSAPVARLSAVLGAMDARTRRQVVQQLAGRNAGLVRRLHMLPAAGDLPPACPGEVIQFRYRLESDHRHAAPRPMSENRPAVTEALLEFDDLALLGNAALETVLAAADPPVVVAALTGAGERLVARILRHLPPREAAVLRQRLAHPGPIRLRDIDEARRTLVLLASRLAREGSIDLPGSVRFAAAV